MKPGTARTGKCQLVDEEKCFAGIKARKAVSKVLRKVALSLDLCSKGTKSRFKQ